MTPGPVHAFANSIASSDAEAIRHKFARELRDKGLGTGHGVVEFAALLGVAYAAIKSEILADPEALLALAEEGIDSARDVYAYRQRAYAFTQNFNDVKAVRRGLRLFSRVEKWRIALRELLQGRAGDVDVTARELSDLAEVCVEVALLEALSWGDARYGIPTTSDGSRCSIAVLGMGKLGGRELNAGSDIDLLVFYETDDGEAIREDDAVTCSLHEYFTRVTQRFVATLDEVTAEGVVWRVDMRLRPEGMRGPLVNAVAAAEHYYETWGRTWERAALLRARPLAGNLAFGRQVLNALSPFVWRREVNPALATEMFGLVLRARAELSSDPGSDLKYGPGGIREAEFFVQSLQLVWGGREPTVRLSNTLEALRRLRARGLVTERESREMIDAYRTLRRLEHRVQFATGIQTHNLPDGADDRLRLARSLGCDSWSALMLTVDKARRNVERRFASLRRESDAAEDLSDETLARERIYAALDTQDEPALCRALLDDFGEGASPDLARHLLVLSRRLDAPLGPTMREAYPNFAPLLFEALAEAADPEQSALLLAAFFAKLSTAGIYTRAFAEDPRALSRLTTLFGASVFLGQAVVGHPELADAILFESHLADPDTVRRAVDEELSLLADHSDADVFVGALRRAKRRVLMKIGLSDLAGDIDLRTCGRCLSALAEINLEKSLLFALRERGIDEPDGIALLAMGKLGGEEVGYGSDLDLIFVYEHRRDALRARSDGAPPMSPESGDAVEQFLRIAQRVLRLVSAPHGEGPGYELDTRLRPSGNQGLLVISIDHFARYHGLLGELPEGGEVRAHDWERQALVKARFCAGDRALGRRAIALAHQAAYEGPVPPAEEVHRLRMRLQTEVAGERRGGDRVRHDLKLGYGGLVDIEFAVQWLQMKFGSDERVRTTETEAAIEALEACGYLHAKAAAVLLESYGFLRKLEQRLRVLHGTSVQLIERGAPGLTILARRMGFGDGPWGSAGEALIAKYEATTRDVRAVYAAILNVSGS